MSWTARKLTNAWVINSVIDMCIFQVSITVFKEFSRLFHTYDHFQGLENFYIKFQNFPYFSRICTNPEYYNINITIIISIQPVLRCTQVTDSGHLYTNDLSDNWWQCILIICTVCTAWWYGHSGVCSTDLTFRHTTRVHTNCWSNLLLPHNHTHRSVPFYPDDVPAIWVVCSSYRHRQAC